MLLAACRPRSCNLACLSPSLSPLSHTHAHTHTHTHTSVHAHDLSLPRHHARTGDLPNVYVYACNNPSESIVAKRRGYGTIVSYNVPPYGRAGLYKQLAELKALLAGGPGARRGGARGAIPLTRRESLKQTPPH